MTDIALNEFFTETNIAQKPARQRPEDTRQKPQHNDNDASAPQKFNTSQDSFLRALKSQLQTTQTSQAPETPIALDGRTVQSKQPILKLPPLGLTRGLPQQDTTDTGPVITSLFGEGQRNATPGLTEVLETKQPILLERETPIGDGVITTETPEIILLLPPEQQAEAETNLLTATLSLQQTQVKTDAPATQITPISNETASALNSLQPGVQSQAQGQQQGQVQPAQKLTPQQAPSDSDVLSPELLVDDGYEGWGAANKEKFSSLLSGQNAAKSSAPQNPLLNNAAATPAQNFVQVNAQTQPQAPAPTLITTDAAMARGDAVEAMDAASYDALAESLANTSPTLKLASLSGPVQPVMLHNLSTAQNAVSQISMRIQQNAQAGQSKFDIQLDPPEMGRINIEMKFDKNQAMKVHLMVEKPETHMMLQKDAQMLQKTLQDMGIEIENSDISFELAQDGAAFDQSQKNAGSEAIKEFMRSSGSEAAANEADGDVVEVIMNWPSRQGLAQHINIMV